MNVTRNFSLDELCEAVAPTRHSPSVLPEEKPHVGPPVGFLPPGQHVVRWFLGPENDYMRAVTVHHYGSRFRTHCPAFLQGKNPHKNYPECAICRLAHQRRDWRLESKFLYMSYGLLIESDNTKKYWKPKQVQLIAGRRQMKRALDQVVKSLLDKNADVLEAFFNPHIPGYATQVSFQQGAQDYPVKIKPLLDKTLPPIALGDWYKPLSECWLSEEFNIKDYEEVLAVFTNNLF